MLHRFPDSYFTTTQMLGTIDSSQLVESAPYFSQGTDIELFMYLLIDDAPLDFNIYDIEILVKKNEQSGNLMWYSKYSDETYITKVSSIPGYYKVRIPSVATTGFIAGLYYIDVKATEKIAVDGVPRVYIVASNTFGIKLSAASPNPLLAITDATELVYDGINRPSGTTSITTTIPQTPDITNPSS